LIVITLRKALAVLGFACLHAAAWASAADLEQTWMKGAFVLPAELAAQIGSPTEGVARVDKFARPLAELSAARKSPIAVLLHGCAGISTENVTAAVYLARKGFSVFLPSYYARSNAIPICAGSAAGVPFFSRVDRELVKLRVEEFDHALGRARALGFTDRDTVLAYGHSMGGIAVAALERDDINAVVITGWGCAAPFASQAPKNIPQLSIRFNDDPWVPAGTCGVRLFGGRDEENTSSVVLDGQRTHEVMHDPRSRAAIDAFLKKHMHAATLNKE
jgi:dienelactone hydrolase